MCDRAIEKSAQNENIRVKFWKLFLPFPELLVLLLLKLWTQDKNANCLVMTWISFRLNREALKEYNNFAQLQNDVKLGLIQVF